MKIHAHHDADGITTAYLTQFHTGEAEIVFPKEFGDTSDFEKGDWMVDMRPQDPNIEGTVLDHHFPHPEDRKYTLIPDFPLDSFKYCTGILPASYIAWLEFKDKIPKNEWWKLAIGLGGDGGLGFIPTELHKLCPTLSKVVKTNSYSSYGKWNISMYPMYRILSSYINAFLRKEEYESALNLIRYSETPMDIYTSEEARIAKLDVKNEYNTIVKDADVFDYGNLSVVIYYSKYRMSGYVATALAQSLNNNTILAINKRDGSASLRGDKATYYRDVLSPLKYLTIDGHAEYMGGKLKKSYTKLLVDMDEIL